MPERFFFYAVQSSSTAAALIMSDSSLPRAPHLSELPPDPQFPFALLPTPAVPGPLGSTGVSVPLPLYPVIPPITAVVAEPTGNGGAGVANDCIVAVAAPALSSSDQSTESSSSTTVATGESLVATSEGPPSSSNSASAGVTPATSLLSVIPYDFVVLLGFGRNAFGRFSVSGIYNNATGELRCEKKYMVTKFTAKRGRRSYAECAATAAASGTFLAGAQTPAHPAAPLLPPSTRQRLAPATHSEYEDLGSETGGISGGGKRKRGLSTGGYLSGSKHATNEGYFSGKTPKAHRGAKENNQAQAASALAAAVAVAGPNALIGSRNPDNDDPESTYREAFMDCDTGEVYEGGWYYGLRHGKGVCLYSDGLMYEGGWVANKEHGKGQLMTADRQLIYTGDWLEGSMHGFGTYNFGNGDRYTGDWREGSRHGKGDYTFRNGCRYSGEWKDNRRSGKGVFVWPDGSHYSGDWEHAQRHGRGKLELANGFTYDGLWSRNVIEGKGVCRFPGGQEYEGTYKNGLREGRGTITFAEGAVYEGRFREDRFDGQGTLKVQHVVPGAQPDELMIPLQVQSDFWRIHLRAGFGNDPH